MASKYAQKINHEGHEEHKEGIEKQEELAAKKKISNRFSLHSASFC
jgi:hypothetical protein